MSVTINLTINGDELDVSKEVPTPQETAVFEFDPALMSGLLSGDEITVADTSEHDEAEAAWLKKRMGRITCSRFGDLMSVGREKDQVFSKTGLAYLRLKIAERLGSSHSVSSPSMRWGKEYEAEALKLYAERNDVVIDASPFQFFGLGDDIGGTPDALVGIEGCVEAKCPHNPAVHINTLLTNEIPKDYEWQVAGHCLVANRKWCDFVSFDPRVDGPHRLVVIRWERDEKVLQHLAQRLNKAAEWVKTEMAKLKELS